MADVGELGRMRLGSNGWWFWCRHDVDIVQREIGRRGRTRGVPEVRRTACGRRCSTWFKGSGGREREEDVDTSVTLRRRGINAPGWKESITTSWSESATWSLCTGQRDGARVTHARSRRGNGVAPVVYLVGGKACASRRGAKSVLPMGTRRAVTVEVIRVWPSKIWSEERIAVDRELSIAV